MDDSSASEKYEKSDVGEITKKKEYKIQNTAKVLKYKNQNNFVNSSKFVSVCYRRRLHRTVNVLVIIYSLLVK